MTDETGSIRLILKAARFAADKHRLQTRKDVGSTPYINHPLTVAGVLAEEGGVTDPRVLAAAILHDTVEDTATLPAELDAEFGPEVAAIVAEVTDDKALDKQVRKQLQVEKAAGKSPSAKLVKLADKISNLRDIAATPPADWDLARRREYFDHAHRVVAGLRGTNAALEQAFDAIYEGGLKAMADAA